VGADADVGVHLQEQAAAWTAATRAGARSRALLQQRGMSSDDCQELAELLGTLASAYDS